MGKVDRHGREQAANRLIADQQRDHRQNDRATETGEIAELAGAEGEARVVGVAAREGIGERGQEQGARVGAHVQAVGDQRNRTEQPTAGDLEQHHGGAEPDDRPGPALALFVALAEKDVAVERCVGGAFSFGHGGPHLR